MFLISELQMPFIIQQNHGRLQPVAGLVLGFPQMGLGSGRLYGVIELWLFEPQIANCPACPIIVHPFASIGFVRYSPLWRNS